MNRTPRTRSARSLISTIVLAVAGLLLTACGGEADEPEAAPEETPSATTSESPTDEPADEPTEEPADEPAEEPAGASAAVTIEGGTVDPVAQSVEVEVGEPVTLKVTADRAGELHVHSSPEQYYDFGSGRSTIRMRFDKPGSVDVEEHESGALVLRVLVQ